MLYENILETVIIAVGFDLVGLFLFKKHIAS